MTPPTSTPEPTGEAKAAEEALYKLITACIIAGHTTDQEKAFEKDRAIERYKAVILKALRSSLPTAPAAPVDLDKAFDAWWDAQGFALSYVGANQAIECARFAYRAGADRSSIPAAPLPGGADLEWLLNVAETYYGKGTNVECKAGVQRAERVRASLLVPAPSNTQERK